MSSLGTSPGSKALRQEHLHQQRALAEYLVEVVSVDDEPLERARLEAERLLSSDLAGTSTSSSALDTNAEGVKWINFPSPQGVTALHVAVWRNDHAMVDLLLKFGADPDVPDGESGWTSLHRACYFGHLGLVARLLQVKANPRAEDRKGRTPFDLLSHELTPLLRTTEGGEVFSWGMGHSYQLGTGCTGEQVLPTPITAFSSGEGEEGSTQERIAHVSAAKYHSCCVTTSGKVLTWGFGRGGRLGHEDFHIHSGQVAVLEPRLVTSGLSKLRVTAVAAAKHHTVCLIGASGDVYTWGSNKGKQLGYAGVDSQPTPRKVAAIKQRIASIAAANKHSCAVTSAGDLLTWGSNSKGQLGYGTTVGSNTTPRIVEALRSGSVDKVSASKNHTVVLTKEGEVWAFGHKSVTPQRVSFFTDGQTSVSPRSRAAGGKRVEFHDDHCEIFRPRIVEVAAGTAHSTAISSLGVVFCWNSFDPNQVTFHVNLPDAAETVSAGKDRTLVCTCNGNVYGWEGVPKPETRPEYYKKSVTIERVNIRRASAVAVGEKHSLAIQRIWYPPLNFDAPAREGEGGPLGSSLGVLEDLPVRLEDLALEGEEALAEFSEEEEEDEAGRSGRGQRPPCASLHELCQKKIAQNCVNTRVLLPMIEFAEMYQAQGLKDFCQQMAIANLDVVAAVRGSIQQQISLEEIMSIEAILPKARIVRKPDGRIGLGMGESVEEEGVLRKLYQRSSTPDRRPPSTSDLELLSLEDVCARSPECDKKKRRRKKKKPQATENVGISEATHQAISPPAVPKNLLQEEFLGPIDVQKKWEVLGEEDLDLDFPSIAAGSPPPLGPAFKAPPSAHVPGGEAAQAKKRSKPRKGNLSLFLKGGLDTRKPKPAIDLTGYDYTSPSQPKGDFPSLASASKKGSGSGKAPVSLRLIQEEQEKKSREEQRKKAGKRTLFGMGGWSPPSVGSSDFRAIQQEQLDLYKALQVSRSEVSGSSPGAGGLSASPSTGWYVPDAPLPDLRAIQALQEEEAHLRELRQTEGPAKAKDGANAEGKAKKNSRRRKPKKKAEKTEKTDKGEKSEKPSGSKREKGKVAKEKKKREKGKKVMTKMHPAAPPVPVN